jgi:antitoxin (DNA-binding transcriptional repressor) of toxin-antitoxin stability system
MDLIHARQAEIYLSHLLRRVSRGAEIVIGKR